MSSICKKCLIGVEAESYGRMIEKSLAAIPARERTGEKEYALRIEACESCGYFLAATCRACGCYVELRAMRASVHCPYKKW